MAPSEIWLPIISHPIGRQRLFKTNPALREAAAGAQAVILS
jgi:hypothetical protein